MSNTAHGQALDMSKRKDYTIADISVKGETWDGNQDQSVYAISKYGAEMEVWRGIQEGVPAVIVNPGVVLGPGFWTSGSGLLFKMAAKGKTYATEGVTGYVAVQDVVTAMIGLMHSSIENQRYILADTLRSYMEIIQMISKELNRKPPTRIASPFLLKLAWRMDWLTSKLMRRKRRLTKQLSGSLQKKSLYSSEKIKQDLEGFTFTPITRLPTDEPMHLDSWRRNLHV